MGSKTMMNLPSEVSFQLSVALHKRRKIPTDIKSFPEVYEEQLTLS